MPRASDLNGTSYSFNRGFAWDLDQIENDAIPNFLATKRDLAGVDDASSPTRRRCGSASFRYSG